MDNNRAAFFDSLQTFSESLSGDEPSAEDQRLAALFSANRRARHRRIQHSNPPQHNPASNTNDISITDDDIKSIKKKPRLKHSNTAPSSYSQGISDTKIAAPLRRANTASKLDSQMPKRTRPLDAPSKPEPKKSKRAKTKEPFKQPLDRQVFKDLTFFFIKPDEKRAERKMRIDKAREYGATVVFEFSKDVTHVILDKELVYQDVLGYLKTEKVPEGLAVTNPRWPGDCIKHGKLVNASDFWYQVAGCPYESQDTAAPEVLDEPSSSANSLQVKARPTKKTLETPTSTPPSPKPGPSRHTPSPRSSPPPYISSPKAPSPKSSEVQSQKDALDEAIEECLASNPINISSFLDSDPISSSPEHSSDESPLHKPKSTSNTKSKKDWQSHFQCMHAHDGTGGSQNPNSRTIQVLEEMMRLYDDTRDEWRTRSYRIAISTLKKSDTKYISTYEDAISLPGVGDRLAKKIVEIVTTDRLQRLEYAKLDPQDQILKLFHGIYGVGLVQARKFVAAGYKTLDEVKEHASLTDYQRIGLDHYHDFKQRIPRSEVAEHGKIVAEALKEIDEEVKSHVMGSYRRGAKDCGDIDIIITKDSAAVEELHDVLEKLVEKLFDQKFLMCGLSIARHNDGTKWHGASKLGEGPWRRIDFLVVPGDEIGAAILYFTGNDVFNRSMRLLASKKGMRLNQRGLYKDVMRGKNREKLSEGTLLESKDEKRIFELLGVPYRPPEHRIC